MASDPQRPKRSARAPGIGNPALLRTRRRAERRARALYQAMSGDFLLREQFVTDPATILSEYVGGKGLSSEASSAANQLLYAVVSNPGMLTWLRRRAIVQSQGGRVRPLAAAFTAAVARNADYATIASLLRCGSGEVSALSSALELIDSAVGLVGRQRQVGTGTEFTPGTGTEFTPGTGTEFTPGTGTEFTRGS
jgi:hypothetical protein